MSLFKIGDRVRVNKRALNPKYRGLLGEIIHITKKTNVITIKTDIPYVAYSYANQDYLGDTLSLHQYKFDLEPSGNDPISWDWEV